MKIMQGEGFMGMTMSGDDRGKADGASQDPYNHCSDPG